MTRWERETLITVYGNLTKSNHSLDDEASKKQGRVSQWILTQDKKETEAGQED